MAAGLYLIAFAFASGCGMPAPAIEGDYPRAAYHLVVVCGSDAPRVVDLLYPQAAFRVEEGVSGELALLWDGEEIGAGTWDGASVSMSIGRRDPFTDPVDWTVTAVVREDLRFSGTTLVGNVSGRYDLDGVACEIAPRSVAWWSRGPRAGPPPVIAPSVAPRLDGAWNRFVWFLDAGPYPMWRKGDPGQRGENLRVFSFATTGGGRVTTGDQAAFVENGFGTWLGAANDGSLTFPQHEPAWELEHAQDLLWDDGVAPGTSPGIRRVLAGWVTGRYLVRPGDYPPGWEGDTGLLPLATPGMSYWLDVDRGE